jgi:hypothetical protein
MGKSHKLTKEQVTEMVRKYKAGGTSAPKLAKEYGIADSTASYHIAKLNKSKPPKSAKTVKIKKPKFIEMPMVPVKSQKVAVIVTDASNIASVIGELWK